MSPGPQKQFDRDEVLEKAMHLFWERGYEATGMTEMLRHVGIGRQSLYDTFGDKRSLYLATLDHYFRTRGGPILAQLRAPGSPMENVRQVFGMWGKMAEDTHFCGCLIGNSAAEMAYTDTEIADRIAGYVRGLEDAFHEVLVRAQEQGEISAKHDPRDVARSFINMIQGMALLSKVLRDPEIARGVLRSTLQMLEVG
jgi:TetR/AcrR family transcriptional repressor of nem operon